jgi:hypothetical protein
MTNHADRGEPAGYEPPIVEDLDSEQGPVETAPLPLPGSPGQGAAAPREL